ncbi:chymotrypsin-like protease CTRL-1 [Drosophila elegans]|uniref:chymotrypsin-like protease CTRL-1 n=1 Tax=Drosophila elegans TaxID=30023 RepID=UPI0007E7B1DF|nr:chymotrypsin-like protease CTRL-1 [Drosophila elegans]
MVSVELLLTFLSLVLSRQGLAQLLHESCDSQAELVFTFSRPLTTSWMASIYNNTAFICGGTLVHKRFVLTAAHCLIEQKTLFVNLGEYNRLQRRGVERYRVTNRIVHFQYNADTYTSDIGLVKLDREVIFTAYIRPICIILENKRSLAKELEAVQSLSAYGWGLTNSSGSTSPVLQTINLTRLDMDECYGHYYGNQICAGTRGGDICDGDSGGPLAAYFMYRGIERYVQFGIVSLGSKLCDSYSVHTDVMDFSRWISDAVREFE